MGQVVDGLYLHLIHARFPTMSFIGIAKKVCPFPLFDRQARFIVATLDARLTLPSTGHMLDAIRAEMDASVASGKDPRHFHVFAGAQWTYNDRLATMAGFEPLLPVISNLYESVCPYHRYNLRHYRSQSFKIVDRQTFVKI